MAQAIRAVLARPGCRRLEETLEGRPTQGQQVVRLSRLIDHPRRRSGRRSPTRSLARGRGYGHGDVKSVVEHRFARDESVKPAGNSGVRLVVEAVSARLQPTLRCSGKARSDGCSGGLKPEAKGPKLFRSGLRVRPGFALRESSHPLFREQAGGPRADRAGDRFPRAIEPGSTLNPARRSRHIRLAGSPSSDRLGPSGPENPSGDAEAASSECQRPPPDMARMSPETTRVTLEESGIQRDDHPLGPTLVVIGVMCLGRGFDPQGGEPGGELADGHQRLILQGGGRIARSTRTSREGLVVISPGAKSSKGTMAQRTSQAAVDECANVPDHSVVAMIAVDEREDTTIARPATSSGRTIARSPQQLGRSGVDSGIEGPVDSLTGSKPPGRASIDRRRPHTTLSPARSSGRRVETSIPRGHTRPR